MSESEVMGVRTSTYESFLEGHNLIHNMSYEIKKVDLGEWIGVKGTGYNIKEEIVRAGLTKKI